MPTFTHGSFALLRTFLVAVVALITGFVRVSQAQSSNPGVVVPPTDLPATTSLEAATPTTTMPDPPTRARGRHRSVPVVLPVATHPFSLDDLALMLRTGLSGPEIIDAVADKQLVSEIGPAQIAKLREQGADDELLDYLQALPLYAAPATASRKTMTAPVVTQVASSPNAVSVGTSAAGLPDHTVRDREIQVLKERIDALDEQIRRIRTDPKGTLGYSHRYQGNDNGINLPAVMGYVDQLDKERNELRRRKWQLEGR